MVRTTGDGCLNRSRRSVRLTLTRRGAMTIARGKFGTHSVSFDRFKGGNIDLHGSLLSLQRHSQFDASMRVIGIFSEELKLSRFCITMIYV